MKLSIIVPVYRVEATLDRCLKSIVGQSFGDFEVILVDDGSPDTCPQLCDDWARRDGRIKVVHQTNGGLSVARNTGIDLAQGEFLTFIDSDDYIDEGTLEAIMHRCEEVDLLEYPVWQHYGSARQTLLTFRDEIFETAEAYWLSTRAYCHTYACNKVYRRKLFDEVRFPAGRVFEDAYTLPHILHSHPRVATISQGLYYYCANGRGITANATGQQLKMLLTAHLDGKMPVDDIYYIHLLNIQIDVYELTGEPPSLPYRFISHPFRRKSSTFIIKAIAQNILGINNICKLVNLIHRVRGRRS